MTSVREAPAHERLPAKPPPSAFVIGSSLFAVALTIVTAREVGFSVTGVVDAVTRQNPVVEGLLSPDWSQVTNERTRKLFVETLGLAVLGTLIGAIVSLPFALLSTTYGNPNSVLRAIVRSANGVIRSIPDLLWALLFVTAARVATIALVGTGMATESAAFQARSALMGVGFTTAEAEGVINKLSEALKQLEAA